MKLFTNNDIKNIKQNLKINCFLIIIIIKKLDLKNFNCQNL